MKVTVCFDDIKVIVPCGSSMPQSNSFLHGYNFKMIDATTSENESTSMSTSSTCSSINSFAKMDKDTSQSAGSNHVKVSSVIESSIARYKKATGKSQNCVVNVLHLQTLRDGGILDPDDYIQDVVEDKELLIAIYEEINYDTLLLAKTNDSSKVSSNNISNSLNNSSLSTASSTSTNCSHSAAISSSTTTSFNINNCQLHQSDQLFHNKNQLNTSNRQIEQRSIETRGNTIRKTDINSSQKCMLTDNSKANNSNSDNNSSNLTLTNSLNSNFIKMSASTTSQQQEQSTKTQYFSRVNSNRQSSVRNNEWSTTTPTNNTESPTHNGDKLLTIVLDEYHSSTGAQTLGIHVVPTYDQSSQCDMGLLIQRIEPNARVSNDGRIKQGDRIIEINGTSLIGVDFIRAQEILREAITHSNQFSNGRLEFKLSRAGQVYQPAYNGEVANERSIEATEENMVYHDEQELQYEINKQNFLDPENKENNIEMFNSSSQHNNSTHGNQNGKSDSSFLNNNPSSVNMSALNTKKLGKKVSVQLVKGPQGLGFKLAARDNCSQGEFSPIYIKNILPKGAAITDGRLQRGDRLLEVNQQDMTHKTLHEAVNILRNTKLGSCVEIVVSRQMAVQQESTAEENCSSQLPESNGTIYATQMPREISTSSHASPHQTSKVTSSVEHTPSGHGKRNMLTFEIALNDTGSAGLGVSVKGKTKRIEENDCSIDLGIFIKTVINGGAASKDGQLKANDQLININGYSLLGKSNEEAMLILREAMQVESRPGYIELTVSRKLKVTPEHKAVVQGDSVMPEVKAVVKVIQHGSPKVEIEQPQQPTGPSRFSRDAPNRRSMSEKRTKIGHSQTTGAIDKYNRALMNDSSTDSQASSIQPKRSKTSEPVDGFGSSSVGYSNSKTLHRNFRSSYAKTECVGDVCVRPVVVGQHQNSAEVNNFKRIGSMDSAGNARLIGSNVGSKIELLRQQQQQQSNQQQRVQTQKQPDINDRRQARRSLSMESIPNIQQPGVASSTQKQQQDPILTQSYGSTVRTTQQPIDIGLDGNEPVVTGNANRFRSINRSFRTAVDKSFDIPSAAGHREMEKSETNNFKNRRNTNTESSSAQAAVDPSSLEPNADGKQKLAHKKSLIETFQKLFKSGSKQKNPSASQQQPSKSPVDSDMISGHQQKSNKEINSQPITLKDNVSSQTRF